MMTSCRGKAAAYPTKRAFVKDNFSHEKLSYKLERINVFLSENPNLLETDRYLLLHSLLGRELYEDGKLLPIEATEIEAVATSHEFKTKLEKLEDS